jgi:hypothetical protein
MMEDTQDQFVTRVQILGLFFDGVSVLGGVLAELKRAANYEL